MTEENGQQVPEILKFSEEDLLVPRSTPKILKEGWMLMEFVSRKEWVAKTGSLMLDFMGSPVDSDGNTVPKAKAKLRLTLPFANKKHPGHKTPNTVFGCYMFLYAVGAPVRLARKGDFGKYNMPDGEVVDQKTAFDYNDGVNKDVIRRMIALYNDKSGLLKTRCYAHVMHTFGEDGRTWCEIDRTRLDPPDDAEIITKDFIVGNVDAAEVADEDVAF